MKIAFASGKGGTGKTTVSVNFALYLSSTRDVLLTDFDVEEPDSHLFIQGDLLDRIPCHTDIPQVDESLCNGCGKCREVCNFHAITQLGDHTIVFPQLCHSCHACVELCPQGALKMVPEALGVMTEFDADGMRFLEARLDIGKEMAVPLIRQASEYIEKNHTDKLIIIDAPPGTSCPVVQTMRFSDFVVLVTEPTPFGLHDLKLAVETVRLLDRPFGVVINKDDGLRNDVIEYCESEAIEVLANFPHRRAIAELYSRGLTLFDKNPDFYNQITVLEEKLKGRKVL